jgi:hypothetical protein
MTNSKYWTHGNKFLLHLLSRSENFCGEKAAYNKWRTVAHIVIFVAFRKTCSGNMFSKLLPNPICNVLNTYIICDFKCLISFDVYFLLIKSCSEKTETYFVSISLSVESPPFKRFTGHVSVWAWSPLHLNGLQDTCLFEHGIPFI